MKKIIISVIFLLGFCVANANSNFDKAFIMGITVSNSYDFIIYEQAELGNSVTTISSTDKVMLYEAVIGMIDPNKKQYDIKIICVDSKDKIIFRGAVKRSFYLKDDLEGKGLFRMIQQIEFNPKPGSLMAV